MRECYGVKWTFDWTCLVRVYLKQWESSGLTDSFSKFCHILKSAFQIPSCGQIVLERRMYQILQTNDLTKSQY